MGAIKIPILLRINRLSEITYLGHMDVKGWDSNLGLSPEPQSLTP